MSITEKPALSLLIAAPRGFCAGVDRAIEIVERAIERYGAPVYVRHEIVHNQYVVNALKAQGAIFVEELDEVPEGAPVVFSAHGVPKSVPGMSLLSCEMDVRTGGKYRLEFGFGEGSMAFYGKYLDVVPGERIVWTNDEGEEGAVTTVTFAERGGKTLLTFHEIYPTSEALEEAMAGSAARLPEQLDQLEEVLSGGV